MAAPTDQCTVLTPMLNRVTSQGRRQTRLKDGDGRACTSLMLIVRFALASCVVAVTAYPIPALGRPRGTAQRPWLLARARPDVTTLPRSDSVAVTWRQHESL